MSVPNQNLPEDIETSSDEVLLEIEGKILRCNKKVLMEESDYFRAMFQGGFAESAQKIVKLNVGKNILQIIIFVKLFLFFRMFRLGLLKSF